MSVDSLGRVIVGSGHFIERAPGIIAQFTHVAVRSGHMVHIQHVSQQVQAAAQNVGDNASNWITRIVDDTIRETAHEAWHREVGEQIVRLEKQAATLLKHMAGLHLGICKVLGKSL